MIKMVKLLNWEMKNDLLSSVYFVVMLSLYCMIGWFFGERQVDIIILGEMFLVNYAIAILQKMLVDDEKDYTPRGFIIRAVICSVIAVALVVAVSILCGWFDGLPTWTGMVIYSGVIASFATVWILLSLIKKYDTRRLNEQLSNFKENNILKGTDKSDGGNV